MDIYDEIEKFVREIFGIDDLEGDAISIIADPKGDGFLIGRTEEEDYCEIEVEDENGRKAKWLIDFNDMKVI